VARVAAGAFGFLIFSHCQRSCRTNRAF